MREKRFSGVMISHDINKYLINKMNKRSMVEEKVYDLLELANVITLKIKTSLNMSNKPIISGYKERNIVFKNNKKIEFNMVYCNSGSFTMGCIDKKNKPTILKKIERSFLLGETEVTQELYELVMGKNYSDFKDPQKPIHNVSWVDAIVFCNALSELQGLDKCYTQNLNQEFDWMCNFEKNGYRLPTSEEWEYAAKAGTNNRWAGTNDEEKLEEYATINGFLMTEVKTKKPNEWGFYDMTGNVCEWCWNEYCFVTHDRKDLGINHGGWYGCKKDMGFVFLLSSDRNIRHKGERNDFNGFRICRSI
jgi:formylglycine-generating enzyme required for sulfatase activity